MPWPRIALEGCKGHFERSTAARSSQIRRRGHVHAYHLYFNSLLILAFFVAGGRAVAVGEAVTVVVATFGGSQVSEPKSQKVKELRHDRLDFHDDRRQRTTLTTQHIGALLTSLDPADSCVLSLAAPSHIGNTASPWIGLGIVSTGATPQGDAGPSS
ncbi:hypothetical protein E4U52_001326 [Claviceps spartinae]|nr:hypothetical protein E4U52_001326 [Claviceps spartinae]